MVTSAAGIEFLIAGLAVGLIVALFAALIRVRG